MQRTTIPKRGLFFRPSVSACGLLFFTILVASTFANDEPQTIRSHPPMRPLPVASQRTLSDGPTKFVDAAKGMDRNDGSQPTPWKTINHAVGQLQPGDTLVLRGGSYYESVLVAVAGTAEKPITIRAFPGELAILDAGLREFLEDPVGAWEPLPGSAKEEFRSTKTYRAGGGFGNFADSMIPFHRYMNFTDLRSANELYHVGLSDRQDDPIGIYCGPGTRRDPETGRIHVRLSHTNLAGLGKDAYRGETDPRKLPLVISGHEYALRIEGARHLRIQDLVVRGAERSAVLITRDQEDIDHEAEDIELDGVTLYGSGAALRISHTKRLRIVNSMLRGHSAPWHSRFTVKNRAGSGYLIFAEGRDFEIAHSELTDHHDCITFHGLDGLKFHHNLVDNFNDDGIEPGPKKARGTTLVYQNLITRTLNPFTAHGSKPIPIDAEPGSGMFVFRNVVDLRQGTYKGPPTEPDPSGKFLNEPTQLVCHDHGSPVHAVYYVYHNTFLLHQKAFRDYYAFCWGSQSRLTTRRVFNNIFVQVEGLPGLNFTGLKPDDDFQADANLLWGVKDGPTQTANYFTKYRKSPLFEASQKNYPPGWGANDRLADPQFAAFRANDFRLSSGSPAVDAGVDIPTEWPDTLRQLDKGRPDLGAFPLGADKLKVGRK